MKKILIIIILVILAVTMVFLGSKIAKNRNASNQENQAPGNLLPIGDGLPIYNGTDSNNQGQNQNNGQPGTGQASLVNKISDYSILNYAANENGEILLTADGIIINSSSSEILGKVDAEDILSGHFSGDGKFLIVKSGNRDLFSWKLFEVSKKTWRDLPINTSEISWSPSGKQFAYVARRADGGGITISNPATGQNKMIITMSAPDIKIVWQDEENIIIMDKPSSLVTQNIWSVNLKTNNMTQLASNIPGAEIVWGGEARGGLLFRAGPTGGVLSIINTRGEVLQKVNFLTFVSKCSFGERAATSTISNIQDYLICGIPEDQQKMKEGQLPEDYLKGKFGTADSIYAIDILRENLVKIMSASQGFQFDMSETRIYGDGMYFINKNDQKLYKVSLAALSEFEDSEGEQ